MDIKSVAVTTIIFVLSLNTNASSIVINEFLPNAIGADSGNEWIELFNNSENTIDIGDWKLQKATSAYSIFFTFPTGLSMRSGDYLVIGGTNIVNADINISHLGLGNAGSSGDALRLLNNISNVIDTVIYGFNNKDGFFDDFGNIANSFASTPKAGQSLGRLINGMDTNASGNDFTLFKQPSLGTSNNLSSVPLPASAWLFASGLIGLISTSVRKHNA